MYTEINFKTKKALREAVKRGEQVEVFYPDPRPLRGLSRGHASGGSTRLRWLPASRDGHVSLEGPHFPAAHTWYAQAEIEDGVIVKVR
jgi:hypothetical protein